MSRRPRNPFRPYPKGNGPVKMLVYGDPGTEKTRRALAMPGPVYVIDLEAGAAGYADCLNGDAHYLSTKSHAEVIEAVEYLRSLPPEAVGTVIVDPVGIIWSSLQNAHVAREARRKNIDPEQVDFNVSVWGKIKRVYGDFITSLLTAPFHVVLTARGKDKIDGRGANIGYGPECEKSTPYLVNIVVEAREGGDRVLKDRTGTFEANHRTERGARIPFTAFLERAGDTPAAIQSDTEAADAAANGEEWLKFKGQFMTALEGAGVSYDQAVAVCRSMNRPEPSAMDETSRRRLIAFLESEKGKKAVADLKG